MARFLRGEYAHPLHLDWPLTLFKPLHANIPSGGRKCGDKCLTDRARAVAYVRYLPVHVLVDHSLDTSDVRARQHQRLQPASSQNDVAR